jgi:CheY-like chemotaxis protein
MKVVLVDDNPELNEILTAIGRLEDVEVHSFTSSLDALGYLATNEADVVIIDLEMPIIDGLRLAKEIRKNEEIHPEKKPVEMVFYTGHEIDETIERVGEKVGVRKRWMIHKPYALSDLVCELKQDLSRPRAAGY